jgi:hypothetical protein
MITALDAQLWAAKNTAKLILAGVIALSLVGSHTGVYFYGKSVQRTSFAAQENRLLEKDLELKQKELVLNAREAETVAARAAASDARIQKGLGELRNAIEEAGINPDCDLSPSELQSLQDIAEG